MEKITQDSLILLLGRTKKYVLKPVNFSCEFGSYDLRKLVGKPFGRRIKMGKEGFVVVKPKLQDMLKKAKRGPQVILPKDSAVIMSVTGCGPGWKVVEAGAGSGFLSMALAIIGCTVHSYERRKEFFEISSGNAKKFGFTNIKVRNADIKDGIKEKNVDMVMLDMQNPHEVVEKAFNALTAGGWLVVYSMHIEEVRNVHEEIAKHAFTEVKILESIHREWQSLGGMSRPKTFMLAHTGFLTFARKF